MRVYKIAKTTLVILAAVVIAGAPGMVAAQTNETSVLNTGDDASVTSTNTSTTSTSVSNSNAATVNQEVKADVNTGFNSASGNIGGGSITSGPAAISNTMGVNVNHNATAISGNSSPLSANATDVVNTGDNADIFTSVSSNNNVNVSNANTANVEQALNAHANTGFNYADENIGGGSVHSGQATVSSTMGVKGNHNMTGIGGFTGQAGLLNDTNITNTGDDAWVNTNVNHSSSTEVSNSNSAWVSQALYGKANSGFNSAGENIGGGLVVSGPARVGKAMGVDVNHNATSIGGGAGANALSFNLHDIVNTGDDMWANTNVNNTSTSSVINANSLYSSQSTWTHSNSGFNATDDNIGGGVANTSGAGISSTFGVAGNHNATSLGGMLSGLMAFMSMM